MTGMDNIEFPTTMAAHAVTRRRLLTIIGAAVVATQVSAATDGPLGPSPAAASSSPPAYDTIIGLL